MAYIGNDLQVAFQSYKVIDDISSSFNGSTTSFALLVSGAAPVPLPLNSQQCLISVAGVIQRPDDSGTEGFRLSGGNIVFSSAPDTGADFFGVILAGADYVNAGGTFPDGSAAVPSITFNDDTDTGFYRSGSGVIGLTSNGVAKDLALLETDGSITVTTLSTTNLKNPSSGSNNIVLNADGTTTIGGALSGSVLASTAEVQGTHTTGTVTSGTTSLTVASATGITAGMYVVGEGITPGTTVSSIAGTTVTLSANANTTLSSDPVSFYATGKVLTPGLVAGQLCRAWVNFDGTGTVAILASYNVSSITDNGTGDYTMNYTSSLPDTNYSIIGLAYGGPAYRAYPIVSLAGGTDLTRTVSSTRFQTYRSGSGTNIEDCVSVNVHVFR